MTTHINPDKRLSPLAKAQADQFDATLLHNRVHEQVQGQHGHESALEATIETAESAYAVAERREEYGGGAAFSAAEQLNEIVDVAVAEEVATACAVIITEADGWTDAWDAADIHEAQAEAREWIGRNLNAAERAGVLEECLDADVPEVTADA
jgi:hypothetical protein